ncbi:hypothetical protein N4T77_14210 [Clostridium sp. CX1]|uniref:Uncharacterized protein n=1 Tax=Clostridium tanneri TaxID=3037988 RepID=A0ABU4JRW7_9CLOT|nr:MULTISPECIES: hypothetical protein [unclassified Clostridium]MCT8977750.1 hypothetical protein [Clostridium sp. CX1]MDW8800890.1 hypothetical protein [Clostridium sp. A1-XYC3]
MKINSFLLSKYDRGEQFEYGVKLIPNRTLDRLTDSMVISAEKNISGKNLFNLCFNKRQEGKLINNKFILPEESFKEYITFLMGYCNKIKEHEKNKKTEFNIEGQGKIIISSLNKDIIKISSEKAEKDSKGKVFFTLLKTEMLQYIKALDDVYLGKEITSLLIYQMGYLNNPLSKKERDKLYLDALYVFADCALDYKDKESFQILSKEIKKISSA